jgi:hypothetical protein
VISNNIIYLIGTLSGAVPKAAMTAIPLALPVPVQVVRMPDDSIFAQLTACGTLVALAALGISWFYNWKMCRESRDNNVNNLRAAQLDRELGWKPHLAFNNDQIKLHMTVQRTVSVSNIGKGPALECRYVGRLSDGQRTHYLRAPLFAVGAEAELKTPRFVEELHAGDSGALKLAARAFSGLSDDEHEVLLCSDVFGNRLRFVRGRPLPDGPIKPSDAASRGRATAWWERWEAKQRGEWVERVLRAEDAARGA